MKSLGCLTSGLISLLAIINLAVVGGMTMLWICAVWPRQGLTLLAVLAGVGLLVGGWMAWPWSRRHQVVRGAGILIFATTLISLLEIGILFVLFRGFH